jgi:hypothetical protein
MKIHLLNHACITIAASGIKLLIDPWLIGECFESGWGLKYYNRSALDACRDCTHLWISHFHSDHFHVPTLREIFTINPGLVVIGNRSFNFRLDRAIARVGFQNIVPFDERKMLQLNDRFRITRFPTTGIDNMLLIQTSEGTILNFNDCNIPERTRRALAEQIGPVDFFLSNFNHAGKMIEHPVADPETIRQRQKEIYLANQASFRAQFLLPFASYHYYRASESLVQNDSLLGLDDLQALDKRLILLRIGDRLQFDREANLCTVQRSTDEVGESEQTIIHRERSYTLEELQHAATAYSKKIRRRFFGLSRLVPGLNIWVTDLNMAVAFHLHRRLKALPEGGPRHIIAHSESLIKWWGKMYGTDSFVVGAHFDIGDDPVPLKWQILFGLLIENRLDAFSMMKMLVSPSGTRFLWNRREEIWAILTGGRLFAASQR